MAKGKKTGGRKKGVPNKATPEIQELAREVTTGNPVYWQNLRARLEEGKAAPAVESAMLAYAHGKPPETVKHVGPDGGPVQIHHHFAASA
jgi:hypothetical protein